MPPVMEQELTVTERHDGRRGLGPIAWCVLPRDFFGTPKTESERPSLLARPPIFGADYSVAFSATKRS